MHRVLITGAAGNMGALLRPRLARPDRVLRLLDLTPAPDPGPAEEVLTADLTDPAALTAACAGVDAVLHLGGYSRESSWSEILRVNVDGTHTVLEAARAAGVPRVILASSNHAVGFRELPEAGADGVPADSTPRPDTYYGFSKAAIEALGSLYHSRFGMHVLCLRIGTCFERPPDTRSLGTWLSPDDAGRLVEACLTVPDPGYRILWGVSANTRRVYSLTEAEAIGYHPRDDAEPLAAEILAEHGEAPASPYLGGGFTTTELGLPN
jgi:uronate dehydrogenase